MLMAIGALLGIPIGILLGWLAGALWHRHEINQLPDVFKTKVRIVSGTYRHTGNSFPRIPARGLWVHDVLIIQKGLMIPRTLHFKIADVIQPTQSADPEQVKMLGDAPVTLQFRLDGGAVIEVAASGEMSAQAQGPFFADKREDVSVE